MFTSMKIELFNSDIDHLMDNYTMRSTNTMKTPASSDTYGWRIIGAVDKTVRMGIDYEHNTRDAEQNMVISGTNRHLAYSWPGAEISKLGFFYEADKALSNDRTMTYGLRWDRVDTDATRAALDPGQTIWRKLLQIVFILHTTPVRLPHLKETSITTVGFKVEKILWTNE